MQAAKTPDSMDQSGDAVPAASLPNPSDPPTVSLSASSQPNQPGLSDFTDPTPAQDDEPYSSEYETDSDAEPEEFYITLDLTIPQPVQAGPSTNPYMNVPRHPPPFKPTSAPPPTAYHKSTPMLGASRSQHRTPRPLPKWVRGGAARKDRLQILDLDTDTPLVNFQNRIWSGRWARTVGSEVFISGAATAATEEDDVVEDQGVKRVPRISGGGYYYSEKDGSLAAAYVGGRRGTQAVKPPRGEEWDGEGEDPEVGRVLAVGGMRVRFVPAAVKAKEWPFSEQLQGKSDFLRRLERIQIEKGELGEAQATHQEGRKRRRRKRGKGVVVEGQEDDEGGWEWESYSENEEGAADAGVGSDAEAETPVTPTGTSKTPVEVGGYFTPGWETRRESAVQTLATTNTAARIPMAIDTAPATVDTTVLTPAAVDNDGDVEMTAPLV